MDLPANFKFDVRIRPRLLARGQITEADVTKHLDALADAQPNSDVIDLPQPALTSLEERERAAATRPSAVVARPAPVAPAERSAPVSIAPSAEPVDEGWDEDDDEDDVDDDDDDDVKDEVVKDEVVKDDAGKDVAVKDVAVKDNAAADAPVKAPLQVVEDEPKAAGGEEE